MRLVFIINGGLGDAAELTRVLLQAQQLGHAVAVCPWRGAAALMVPLWQRCPGLRVITRDELLTEDWDAALCSTTAEALATRTAGVRATIRSNGPPSPRAHMLENYQRLLAAVGHPLADLPPLPPAPLAHLLPPATRDLLLVAPGVGAAHTHEQAADKAAKLYDRWPALLSYLPRPLALIGDATAAAPWQDGLPEVENLIGTTPTLADLLPLFARARMLFAPDNGLHHLAALFGVPVVSLWTGATDPEKFAAPGAVILAACTTSPGAIANQLHLHEQRALLSAHTRPAAPVLSVIITTHNEGDEVALTLADVRAHAGCALDLVVVDDASTDGSTDHLPPDVRLVRNATRHGVAPCRNQGAAAATGDAFLFLDAHMRLAPGTGEKLLAAALAAPCVALAGIAALYSPRAGTVYGDRWKWHERLRAEGALHQAPSAPTPVPCFRAPGWCVSRATWATIGPWPAALSQWGSTEVALALRANLTRTPILAIPQALVWHRYRGRFPYSVSPAAIQRNAVAALLTAFGRADYLRHFYPLLRAHYWSPAAEAMHDDPAILAQAADFAPRRQLDAHAWLAQHLPHLLPVSSPAPASPSVTLAPVLA